MSSSQTPNAATPDAPKLLKKASTKDAKASDAQTVFACQHTKGLLTSARDKAIDGYRRVLAVLNSPNNISYQFHKDTADGVPACTVGPTYLCLQCPNVSKSRERHRRDHGFAVESTKGFLWCHECRDFVYDEAFENVRAPDAKKRKHAEIEDDAEKKMLSANTTPTSCAAIGLRGFYNMGQTCFMSVILQCLINNPLISMYYLTEGHKSGDCEREYCTSCALDDIVTDFYGTEKHEGYGAVQMLQACWKNSPSLAGYQQQDAHEFFGFIINSLHEADGKNIGASKCECEIHGLFSGTMHSTVTCTTCKTTNTTSESYMDLSLDVKSAGYTIKKKKLALTGGTQTVKEPKPVELVECLERFTSPETLSSDSYHCRNCDAAKEAKKTLSLPGLPPTVAIHLKRFSHSKLNSQSTKVDSRVRFPFKLDFAPFIAANEHSKTTNGHADNDADADGDTIEVNTLKKNGNDDAESGKALSTMYDLSSVVVHKGKIDNGHYISYSRRGKEWFRFDDEKVVLVDEKEVLGAEAYMLFYVLSKFTR